jgi:hypothetical protein
VLHSKEHLSDRRQCIEKHGAVKDYNSFSPNNEKALSNSEKFQQRVREEKWMHGELKLRENNCPFISYISFSFKCKRKGIQYEGCLLYF